MFLVDDHQPQVPEYDVFLKKAVSPDDDVHGPFGQPVQNLLLLGGGLEPAEGGHLDGKPLKPFGERLEMLLCKDCGGNQQGHLLVVHDSPKSRPQSHFGLAVAHVAADQPVHGTRGSHVLEDILDGSHLILSFLEGKGGFEFPKVLVRAGKGKPFPEPACGIELEKFSRDALG